ncbi:hypothetical protein ACWCXC_31850 [Streptomyces sp. NPDC001515]
MSTASANALLLTAALDNARTELAEAETVDITDDLALVASHAAVTDALRRVLWALNELDDEPDVAAQVAAEDGVRHIGAPVQRNGSVAA